MVDDYLLDKVLEKLKEILHIEKFDNTKKFDHTKTLIDTDNKLPVDITLKNIMILMTSVIKNGSKFYPQLFSEETLFLKSS